MAKYSKVTLECVQDDKHGSSVNDIKGFKHHVTIDTRVMSDWF